MAAAIERRALAGLLAGAILIGFAPIFIRLIDVGYTAAGFWRVFLSLPFLWVLWRRGKRAAGPGAPAASRAPLKGLFIAGLFFALDLATWHQSIRYTSIANATLLANLCPIFVTAAGVLLFGERVRAGFVAGLVLALAGSGLLVASSFSIGPDTVMGDALGVLAAMFYSVYLMQVSRERGRHSAVAVMWWSTLASAVLLLPATLLTGEVFWPQSAQGWAVLFGLALVGQVAGQGLIAWGMAHLSAAFSSVSLLVQPVAAALFAWWLIGESFGPLQALGGVVVLGGIVLCRFASLPRADALP